MVGRREGVGGKEGGSGWEVGEKEGGSGWEGGRESVRRREGSNAPTDVEEG